MKKIYFSLVALMMFVAMPSMAQLEELSGKVIALGSAATEITQNQWYVMKNGGRGAYAYENESKTLKAMATSGVSLSGASATEYAGYLVRFVPVDGQDGSYYMQTGYGNYWGELTKGSNNGTTTTEDYYFVSGKISGYDNWFDFVGNNGEMVLDCNESGGTVAGWGTDLPTSTSSNAAWQILPVTLTSEGDMCTAKIKYTYVYGGEEVYTYTQTQTGVNTGFEVVFDEPGERYGVRCKDETPENETITEDQEFEIDYEYEDDPDVTMPFKTTKISGGEFASDTKWYYMSPYSGTDKSYYSYYDGSTVSYTTNSTHPLSLDYMFCFTGNPFAGYQIYNYSVGADQGIYGNVTDAGYGEDVEFNNPASNFYLKEGYYYGYSFNLTKDDQTYLNGYSNKIQMLTWGNNWAWADNGSAYDITEVSEEELAKALNGMLTYEIDKDSSYPSGYIFRNGTPLDAMTIQFYDDTNPEAPVTIADGMEEEKITLTDSDGNVVATPGYEMEDDDDLTLDIIFDPEFSTPGTYYLNIPEGLLTCTSEETTKINEALQLKYTFMPHFEAKIVTARIWKSYTIGSTTYTNWPVFNYPTNVDGDYYTCKINVSDQDEFSLIDWENTGDETNILKVNWDTSNGKGEKINDESIDSNESVWASTKILYDYGYYGVYFYPTYSPISFDGSHGTAMMEFYSYQYGTYYYVCADWYMDDRYAADAIKATVYKYAFKDLNYDNATYPSYTQLPYDSETNTYDAKVVAWSEDSLTIQNYDGKSSISFKIDGEHLSSVNGETADATYGTVWVKSTVIDGTSYNGWYCYPEESTAKYDPDTKSGYVVFAGLDYSVSEDGDWRYIYIGIGDYEPELDKPTGINDITDSMNNIPSTIYNISGQRISKIQKGLNIIDSKKVVY